MDRQNVFSGSPWEPKVGFSRAVRVGEQVFLAGTLDTGPDGTPVGGDAYEQAVNIFRKFEGILEELGGGLENVVRTRMYLLDLDDVAGVSRAHSELLGGTRPAATMLLVAGFVGQGFKVEIEADAILGASA